MPKLSGSTWLALGAVVAALLPRLLFPGDMEFKGDEVQLAGIIAGLGFLPAHALADISQHSGVAGSSGAFYLMKWLSLGSSDPLRIALGIIVFNVLSIAPFAWLLRSSRTWLLTFLLCATSTALILHSRKIWVPDLQAPWLCLSLGFYALARERFPGNRWLPALSGFCAVMVAHMYMPGFPVAAVASLIVPLVLLRTGEIKLARLWSLGAVAGWITFLPYAWLMLIGAPGTRAPGVVSHSAIHFPHLVTASLAALELPSPLQVYMLYLHPGLNWLRGNGGGALLWLTVALFALAVLLWLPLYWLALSRALRKPAETLREPFVFTALVLLPVLPLGMFLTKVGNHLHYWLGALPLVFHLVAWTAARVPRLSRLTVLAGAASLASALSLQALVHNLGGLPGEYWQTYKVQQQKAGFNP